MEKIYSIDLTEIVDGVEKALEHSESPHAPLTTTPPSVITTWTPDLYLDHPPEGFAPCIPDDKTDNSAAFLKLADEATKRHCHLVLPYGKTQVNKFDLTGRKGVILKGSGAKVCILKQTPRQEMDFVTLTGADWISDSCGLMDVGLEGNSQVGAFSLLKIAAVNGCCKFRDLFFYNGHHALTFESKLYCWMYNPSNLFIMTMRGRGINGLGTDNSLSTIDIAGTQDYCIYASGANCRINNVKIMGSVKSSGLFINGSRLQFNGIDSQESFMHGVHFKDAFDCTITSLNCDNNGYNYPSTTNPKTPKTPPNSYGLFVESGEYNTISDYNFSNRNVMFKYGVGAYSISSTAKHYTVRLNDERNPAGASTNNSPTSTIVRN